jgi:hypothetical protein
MSDAHPLEGRWPELKSTMEKSGADEVVSLIKKEEDPGQCLSLFSFAQQAFGQREWEGKNFDAQIELVREAMREALSVADKVRLGGDDTKADRVLDFANVMSYNLSADLACCWPGDEVPRSKAHLEAGLLAAAECLFWREQLKKGPAPFAMAWWAKGIHELFLQKNQEALESLQMAVKTGREASLEAGRSGELGPDAGWFLLINDGALALAELQLNLDGAETHYQNVLDAFAQQKSQRPDEAGDAQFGIDQLEVARLRLKKL